MKKSKVIIPALGILSLSTAAAVTGTVAWFTAARVKSFAMSGITAVNPESGLTLALENVNNTVITGEDGSFNVAHAALRDGSVDVEHGKVYGSILGDDGSVVGYKDVSNIAKSTSGTITDHYYAGNVQVNATPTDIFYATEFKASFGLSRDGGYIYNLFFDAANSSVAATGTALDDGTGKSVLRGLRIGMKAGSEWFVWAPLTELEANAIKYVSGAVAAGGTLTSGESTLDAANVIKGAGTALPTEEIVPDSTATTRVEYLGKPTNATTLDVTIYTWFEGMDPAVNNDAKQLETAFTANLSFKMYRNA